MAENPITPPLPADLPENWQYGQIVAPAGADVGLSEQHGYNYLMAQVNAAQQGVNTLGQALEQVPALGDDGRIAAPQLPEGSLQVKYPGGVSNMPASANWLIVAYGGGKFVAVADNSSIAAYSDDGVNWTQTAMPASANWYSVAYGGGKFVATAAGNSNIAAYSADGITWVQTTMPETANWLSVAYGNGRFVAVSGVRAIAAYSEDGINWTQTTMPNAAAWYSVAYGDEKFVAVTNNGNVDYAAYSEDGITWTQTSLPAASSWRKVAYGDGKFVATAYANIAAYSEDGITWTQTTMPISTNWLSVAYGGGKFVALSASSNIDVAAASEDGITWMQTSLLTAKNYRAIAYGKDKFIATLNSNSDIVVWSHDGIHWLPQLLDSDGANVTDEVAAALQMGDKADKSATVSATLTASGWSGSGPWTQTVTVAGLTSGSNGIVGPSTSITDAQFTAMQAAALRPSAQAENSLTIKATGTKPTVNLPIQVVIVG